MGFDDYEGMWPKDGMYAQVSRGQIAKDLFEAGKIDITEVIDFIGRQPLDLTKAFEGALLMAGLDEAYRHVTCAEAIMMPDGSIGIGVQVCDHFKLADMSAEHAGFWQLAILAALRATGFEVRYDEDGQMQIRLPALEGQPTPEWTNMATEQVVSTFIEELDEALGPSFESRRNWWGGRET